VLRYAVPTIGVAVLAGSLVLTRSRAGFLAFGAALLVFFAAPIVSPAMRRHGRTWARLAGLILLAAGGVVAAVIVPNTLRWRSANPYLESLAGVTNYQEGSGRGRLVQYRRSMLMAVRGPRQLVGRVPGARRAA
jgi:MFS family permease